MDKNTPRTLNKEQEKYCRTLQSTQIRLPSENINSNKHIGLKINK